ncbi:MAG: complex I subunit 1 family protein [Planctomycetota bacterium]|nr:complex I subunit 1 family protein [Planctomycetota bacterium]
MEPMYERVLPLLKFVPEFADSARASLGISDTLWAWMVYLVLVGSVVGIILGMVAYSVLFERKVAGFVQQRPGPNRVGPWGLFQPIADGIKLMFKEDIIHTGADKSVFKIAPFLAFIAPMTALAAIPLAPGFYFANYATGLLFVFAFGGLAVLGILTAGYSSNNKFSLMGGLRGASQLISYEVPFLTTVLATVLIVSSKSPAPRSTS